MKVIFIGLLSLISLGAMSQEIELTNLEKARDNGIGANLALVGSGIIALGASTLPKADRKTLYYISGGVFLTSVTLNIFAWSYVGKSNEIASITINQGNLVLSYKF